MWEYKYLESSSMKELLKEISDEEGLVLGKLFEPRWEPIFPIMQIINVGFIKFRIVLRRRVKVK